MDWLPPTIATRSLLPFPRGGEGGVLFLFPIETAEGKRAAAALLPREAILNTILEDTAVMVTSDDLRYLAAIPEVLATGSRQGATGIQDVKQEYLAVISPLDAANSAIYINFALDNPSIESQAYHLLWIEHALSSNDKDRVSKILRPLRGGALDELKNKPVRIADEIGRWTAEYKANLTKLIHSPGGDITAATFRMSLVHLNRLPVSLPMPDIGERRRGDLKMVFTLLEPDERDRLYATLVKSPSYAYLIREFADLKISIPEYRWRMKVFAASLRTWRHEERRVIMPRIENRREELSSLSRGGGAPSSSRVPLSASRGRSPPPRAISPLSSPRGGSPPPRGISPLSSPRDKPPLDIKAMPEPLEPVSAESPYVFTLQELESWKAATICTQTEATEVMQLFTGGILDGIDLSGAVITGSSITASVYRPWGHSAYLRNTGGGYHPIYTEGRGVKKPSDNMGVALSFLALRYPAYAMRTGDGKLQPASDIDIAVIDEKNYSTIAGRILRQLRSKHPRLEISVREGRRHPVYSLTDPAVTIRPIQIYPASLAQILTHHTAPVRGWCDTRTGTFHISASAALSYVTRGIDDYYYFAGRDPIDIIGAINDRGFNINLARPIVAVLNVARAGREVPISPYHNNFIHEGEMLYALVRYGDFDIETRDLSRYLIAKQREYQYLSADDGSLALDSLGRYRPSLPILRDSIAVIQEAERELVPRLRVASRIQQQDAKKETFPVAIPPSSSLPTREATRLPLPSSSRESSRSVLPLSEVPPPLAMRTEAIHHPLPSSSSRGASPRPILPLPSALSEPVSRRLPLPSSSSRGASPR